MTDGSGCRVKETRVPHEKGNEGWCLTEKGQSITQSLSLHNLGIKRPRNHVLWGSNEGSVKRRAVHF